jgi:hypothetical protein
MFRPYPTIHTFQWQPEVAAPFPSLISVYYFDIVELILVLYAYPTFFRIYKRGPLRAESVALYTQVIHNTKTIIIKSRNEFVSQFNVKSANFTDFHK